MVDSQYSMHAIALSSMVEGTPTSFLPTHLMLILIIATLILITSFYKRSSIKEKIRRIDISISKDYIIAFDHNITSFQVSSAIFLGNIC